MDGRAFAAAAIEIRLDRVLPISNYYICDRSVTRQSRKVTDQVNVSGGRKRTMGPQHEHSASRLERTRQRLLLEPGSGASPGRIHSRNPVATVTLRDLARDPLPHIDDDFVAATRVAAGPQTGDSAPCSPTPMSWSMSCSPPT